MRSVTSTRGRPSWSSGIDVNAFEPARLRVPDGFDAEQSEGFRDIVAVGPHLRCAPDAEPHHLGILAFFLAEALDSFAGKLLADSPGRLRGQRARIDRIEIAAGRQNVRHAAGRCAGRTGGNIFAFKRIEQVLDLIAGLLELRHKLLRRRR